MQQLLAQHRALLVWDNFESVQEMTDPAGATPPLDEPEYRRLREFLQWVGEHSASTVIITSRAPETWLGQVRRITVGGLNRAEAVEYAGHLLASFPAARQRRKDRSFGELLDWLDGHPLAMRLTLPLLDTADAADLLAGLRGTAPLPGGDAGTGRLSSLAACITYSFAHLADRTRQLLPALSLFHGIADADILAIFSVAEGAPGRFAGTNQQQWTEVLEDAARVGLLTGFGGGHVPGPPGAARLPRRRLAGREPRPLRKGNARRASRPCAPPAPPSAEWLAEPDRNPGTPVLAYTLIGLQRRTLGAMLGYALDRQVWWPEAEYVVRALDAYWDARGLGGPRPTPGRTGSSPRPANPDQAPPDSARSLWLYTIIAQADRQTGRRAAWTRPRRVYRRALAYLHGPACNRAGPAAAAPPCMSYQLGWTAQDRGRLDEADGWYRTAIGTFEELGDRRNMAITYHQLGSTALLRGQMNEAEGVVSQIPCHQGRTR